MRDFTARQVARFARFENTEFVVDPREFFSWGERPSLGTISTQFVLRLQDEKVRLFLWIECQIRRSHSLRVVCT